MTLPSKQKFPRISPLLTRKWQATPVFCLENSRGLVGCIPCGHRVGHDLVAEHTHKQQIHICICISLSQIRMDEPPNSLKKVNRKESAL